MSAIARLKRRPEFLKVAATRRKWVAAGLIVQSRLRHEATDAADAHSGQARIGFTVSRKVGNAVARNRVRRRLKAAARIVMTEHARAGMDFVIIGRRNSLTRSFADLEGDLTTALKKLDGYQ